MNVGSDCCIFPCLLKHHDACVYNVSFTIALYRNLFTYKALYNLLQLCIKSGMPAVSNYLELVCWMFVFLIFI